MADSFDSFARKVQAFEAAISDDSLAHVVGKKAKELASEAARNDLGPDAGFTGGRGRGSGWRADTNFLSVRYDIVKPGQIQLKPTRRNAGPWTVAERGRKSYAAGDRRSSGMGRARKDGTRAEKFRTVKRNVRETKGFGTASDAIQAMNRDIPGVTDREIARQVRKFFG